MSVFGATQFVSRNNTSVNPFTITVNAGSGDLIIVGFSGANSPNGVPTDTIGNTYVLDAAAFGTTGFGTRQYMWYCLGSIGANASNVISVPFTAAVTGVLQAWVVPLTGGTALFDVAKNGVSNGAANPKTAAFNTAGTDEYVAIGTCSESALSSNYTAGGSYTLDGAAVGVGSITRWGGEHFIYSSTQTGITPGFTQATSADYSCTAIAIKANPLFSISGSAAAGAKIWYVGTASGSVIADGSGNWTIPNLANGSYTLFATCAFRSFSPLTSSQTVSGSNITGVTFTPTTSRFGTPVRVGGTASAATTVTATSNTAANDLIVVTTVSDHSTAPTSVTDTVGNTYTQAGTITQLPTGTTYLTMWYCAQSIGANASNVITVTYSGNTTGTISVRNVPLTAGFKAVFDVTQVGSNFSGSTATTAAFTTTGTDEIVLAGVGSNAVSSTYTVQNGYLLDNGGSGLSLERIGEESVLFGATQTGITSSMGVSAGGSWAIRVVAFKPQQTTWTISGNAGVAAATVSYTGTSSGSTSADGSGNYAISGLVAGSYTITPTKTGYTFSPTFSNQTIVGSDITGVNFTATAVFTISGNAGTCGATVSYTGAASGSVVANSSGDYTISGLVAGSYTITPTKASYTFSPASTPETITSSNITGVNFFVILDPATGILLTPVYTNSCTGANQNPMDPTNLDPGSFAPFQILSNSAQGTDNTAFAEAFYFGAPALGNDQYGQITIHNWVSGASNEVFITVRTADNTDQDCYALSLFDNNDGTATISVDAFVGNVSVQTLYLNAAATLPVLCDMYTLAVVGNFVALYKNTTQLFVGVSTHRSTGSASFSLATPSPAPTSNLTLTNFVFGNATGLLPPAGFGHSPWISPLVRSSIEKGNA